MRGKTADAIRKSKRGTGKTPGSKRGRSLAQEAAASRREAKMSASALRVAEGRIQQALRVSRSFTFDWEPSTDRVWRSESCAVILALPVEEAVRDTGQRYFKRVHPEDRVRFEQLVKNLTPAASSYQTEYRLVRGDGSVVVLEETGQAAFDAAGHLQRLFGVATDITARRTVEAALRRSEDRYHTLFREMDEGYCIIEMIYDGRGRPNDWRFIEVNPSFARHNGLTDAAGKTIRQMTPNIEPKWFARYGEVARTGQPLRFEEHSEALGRWFDLYAFPIGQPEQHRVAVLFTDITARKQAEDTEKHLHEVVATEKERLAALINSVSDEIWFTDKNGKITLVNPSAVREFRIKGKGEIDFLKFAEHLEVLRPDGSPRPVSEAPPLRALRGEFVVNQEELVRTPATGEFRCRQVSAAPVRDAHNQIYGAVSIVRDITDLKRIEAKIRNVNQELESRVAKRTAELQAALDALRAENAERQRLESEILKISDHEQSRIGQDLHDGACQGLVGLAVLAEVVAREHGRENPRMRERMVEISRLARQSADEVRRLAAGLLPLKIEQLGLEGALRKFAEETSARNDVTCRFLMCAPVRISDNNAAVQLFRIAQEATGNALRHARARNIAIELAQSHSSVTLLVRDDGVGLSRKKNRSGMGLHTMQYRARILGGSLEISRAAKRGTAVTCSFPAKAFALPEQCDGQEGSSR